MRNSAKKKPVQKPIKSQSAYSGQTTLRPLNDTTASNRSFDFLINQLEYVTLFRTETFKRLSLVLAFSSFMFLLLVSEVTYAYANDLWHDTFIIGITIGAFIIFTVIWVFTIDLLRAKVMDKTSLMIPSRILELGRKGYEDSIHSKVVRDFECMLIQEIYAVSQAERQRSIVVELILRALTILYFLVITNSLRIAYLQIKPE